jgi:hypothetical protein
MHSYFVRQLPLGQGRRPTNFFLGANAVSIAPYRVVVWVSLCDTKNPKKFPNVAQFPAVIDTAFDGSLLLRQEHLVGLRNIDFPRINTTRTIRGCRVDELRCQGWLYKSNRLFGSADAQRTLLQFGNGISVLRPPQGSDRDTRPSVPVIGMRALTFSQLKLIVDGNRRTASVVKPWLKTSKSSGR